MQVSQPFCLFCEDDKMNRMLCEREMVSNTKHKIKSVQMGGQPPFCGISMATGSTAGAAGNSAQLPCYMSEEEFPNYSRFVDPLTNGYCRDTASILGANNLDLLSPLLALEYEEAFPVVRAFLTHLLKQYNMVMFIDLVSHCRSILIILSVFLLGLYYVFYCLFVTDQ